MSVSERTKKLTLDPPRLRLSEHDLREIAATIQEAASKYQRTVSIEITTIDGEDTIRTDDPDFFLSRDMPARIQSIWMYLSGRELQTKVSLRLEKPGSGYSNFEIGGTDTGSVVLLHHELERVLKNCRPWGGRFRGVGTRMLTSIGIGIIVSLWAFLSVDKLAGLIAVAQGMPRPEWRIATPGNSGLFLMPAYLLAMWIESRLNELFPRVEFAGRLEDTGTRKREGIWKIAKILGAFVVSVAAGLAILPLQG